MRKIRLARASLSAAVDSVLRFLVAPENGFVVLTTIEDAQHLDRIPRHPICNDDASTIGNHPQTGSQIRPSPALSRSVTEQIATLLNLFDKLSRPHRTVLRNESVDVFQIIDRAGEIDQLIRHDDGLSPSCGADL